jgi:hypothetical protein
MANSLLILHSVLLSIIYCICNHLSLSILKLLPTVELVFTWKYIANCTIHITQVWYVNIFHELVLSINKIFDTELNGISQKLNKQVYLKDYSPTN